MADHRQISVGNVILVTLSSLAAAFQLCGITYLILETRCLQMVGFQIANQYDIAVARLQNAPRQACHRGRAWRKPGRLAELEWKNNFQMDYDTGRRIGSKSSTWQKATLPYHNKMYI